VFAGGAGSGKSIALAALAKREEGRAFILHYPLARWPGQAQAALPGENHLAQIMSAAASALREYLFTHQDKAASLTQIHWEYVRWLVEKFNGRRMFLTWANALPEALASQLTPLAFDDLFPTTTKPLDVAGQVDELVNLARRLGFQYVLILSDVNSHDISAGGLEASVKELFGSLDVMQHAGFSLTAALPNDTHLMAAVTAQSSGRVSIRQLRRERSQLRAIADLHLSAAHGRHNQKLDAALTPSLLARLEARLVEQYGGDAPQGWVQLADTVHVMSEQEGIVLPLGDAQEIPLVCRLFARHMKLRLDQDTKGVWIGPKLIPLTDQPLDFIRLLHKHQGKPVHLDNSELFNLVGKKQANLHALASRTRKLIKEPDPDHPIYIQSGRGEGGYWLENYV
jgi:hypothetical protein